MRCVSEILIDFKIFFARNLYSKIATFPCYYNAHRKIFAPPYCLFYRQQSTVTEEYIVLTIT